MKEKSDIVELNIELKDISGNGISGNGMSGNGIYTNMPVDCIIASDIEDIKNNL